MCHHFHVSDSRTRQEAEPRFTWNICLSIPSIRTQRSRNFMTYPTIGVATGLVLPYAAS